MSRDSPRPCRIGLAANLAAPKADRIERLNRLLDLAARETRFPGFRGGMPSRVIRAQHVLKWQSELEALSKRNP